MLWTLRSSREAKKKVDFKLVEYTLKFYATCSCCGTVHIYWYFMKDSGEGFLNGDPIPEPPPEVKYRIRRDKVYSCFKCRSVLETYTKEMLIDKVIFTYQGMLKFGKEKEIEHEKRKTKEALRRLANPPSRSGLAPTKQLHPRGD
jgi:hypothetical protein